MGMEDTRYLVWPVAARVLEVCVLEDTVVGEQAPLCLVMVVMVFRARMAGLPLVMVDLAMGSAGGLALGNQAIQSPSRSSR